MRVFVRGTCILVTVGNAIASFHQFHTAGLFRLFLFLFASLTLVCANAGISKDIMIKTVLALSAIALGSAMELTADNWDEATSGKTVFIKVSCDDDAAF